ncbi:NAD(P)-binding protein [Athelia psychrophila]|uniref:NAD(P)-binding protein n=1 Tax=Athelia psychrophila TaxID=1759441 RepID=A0A166D2V5_9AGAM|nr:NAD(P)-binding protein [Fibularhizoctonia sp. CBS 109695]
MSKVILVTGANSGIGLELAKLLAEQGHSVYAAARSQAGVETIDALKTANLKSVQLDVTDVKSIIAAKDFIEKDAGHIDVLVNNAGDRVLSKPQVATNVDVAVVRAACEVNLFGLIQTTTTLLPLVLKSSKPNILNISTDMASNTYQARPDSFLHVVAYNTSKAAANSYTIALAHELKGKAIVNAVTPGRTTTKLNNYATGHGAKTPEEAAVLISKWVLEEEKSGLFIGPDGNEFPW